MGVIADTASNFYYVVRGLDAGDQAFDSNRAGECTLTLLPGWNLLSLPLAPAGATWTTLSEASCTAHITLRPPTGCWCGMAAARSTPRPGSAAAKIARMKGSLENHWLENDYSPSEISLTADIGFWVQNRRGETEYLVVVGEVAEADHTLAVGQNWQLAGMAFPVGRALDEANLPATGADQPLTADRVLVWDAAAQVYQSAWYCGGAECESWGEPWANHWLANDYSPSGIILAPGMGFWYQNRHTAFTWNSLRPAPELQLSMSGGEFIAEPGDVITYTLTYTNSGLLSGMGVWVTETLPVNTVFTAGISSLAGSR